MIKGKRAKIVFLLQEAGSRIFSEAGFSEFTGFTGKQEAGNRIFRIYRIFRIFSEAGFSEFTGFTGTQDSQDLQDLQDGQDTHELQASGNTN